MNEFTIVTVIGRPVDEVFAVLQDVARTPVWTSLSIAGAIHSTCEAANPPRYRTFMPRPRASPGNPRVW